MTGNNVYKLNHIVALSYVTDVAKAVNALRSLSVDLHGWSRFDDLHRTHRPHLRHVRAHQAFVAVSTNRRHAKHPVVNR